MKRASWKKVSAYIAVGALSALFVAGCSNQTKAAKTNTSVDKTAIKGQTLTVYSAGPDELSTQIKEAFEKKTGVKVQLFQGTTGKILAKMEAEKNKPVVDVVVLASLSSIDSLKENGTLQAYKGAVGKENLNKDWVDSSNTYFAYSASALGITYNTKNVTTPPKDWSDLTESKWKNQLNIPDPTLSGSALDFIYGYTAADKANWSTIKDWKANGLEIMGANKEALDSVITGEKNLTLSGVDYMAYQAKAKGEPIDIVYPSSGTVVSPRAAGITKTSKHVGAAQAYIDFLLSDEGQKMVADDYLLPGNAKIAVKDRAALADIKQIKVNWKKSESKQATALTKFTDILNP